MSGLADHVDTLETLCHRYLKQPTDELVRQALFTGLKVARLSASEDDPAIVRGLVAQCHTYAQILEEDLARGNGSTQKVRRLCSKLADFQKTLK